MRREKERRSTTDLKSLEAVGQEQDSIVWHQTLFTIKKAASKVNRRFIHFDHPHPFPSSLPKTVTM